MFTQAMEDETIMLPFYLNFAYLIDITQVEPVAKSYFDNRPRPRLYRRQRLVPVSRRKPRFYLHGPFEDKAKKQFSHFFGSFFLTAAARRPLSTRCSVFM
jgi:hypothetical protein